MNTIPTGDPLAIAVTTAIRTGDVPALLRLLDGHPGLATTMIGGARSLLHVATDHPGRFPNCAGTIALLVERGADINARFSGAHTETPLHWAASCDDVEALDALLDAGAEIEATGAVIAGGTPLTNAVAFAQWNAAHRLVERGARTTLGDAAALGLLDRVEEYFGGEQPAEREINHAFWLACHGGQHGTAEYLLDRGADPNWLPDWERLTPLDAARRNGFAGLVTWLRERGGRSAGEGA